jgi:hypothetical protein
MWSILTDVALSPREVYREGELISFSTPDETLDPPPLDPHAAVKQFMIIKRQSSRPFTSFAVWAILALSSSWACAGTLSFSPTAPVIDGADIANLVAGTGTDKFWTDTRALGQTFTTGGNLGGYTLHAITLQNSTNTLPTKSYDITIGQVSSNTYVAGTVVSDTGILQTVANSVDDYWTFSLGSPVTLTRNATYGFDVAMKNSTSAWQTGIPYFRTTANTAYAGGQLFRSNTNATSTSPFTLVNNDRVFHLDISPNYVPLYWDTNGAATGTNVSSSGNWADASWSLDPNGEDAATHAWAAGYDAIFSAGTNGTGTQTIAVTGTQNVRSMAIEEGSVVFTGNGTIQLDGGAGTAMIDSGSTLSGNVTIGGNVTGDGNIAPGLSPGAITIDGAFDMSGTYLWELGAHQDDATGTAGADWDLVNAGSADLTSLTLDLGFILSATDPDSGDAFWNSDHTWLVVDSTAALTGIFSAITYQGGVLAFDAGTFATFTDGNQAFLQFTSAAAVPEPASIALWSLLGLGLVGLVMARRYSRQHP